MTRKMGKVTVAELKKRSKDGLEYAKQILWKERIESTQVREAIRHYFEHWNDFMHPGMFSIACEAAGKSTDDAKSAQAAIAMIAAAFDLHDDIIDESKTKYGAPTVYGKFGAEASLLLGNAFLIEGFTLLADSLSGLSKDAATAATKEYKKLLFEVGNAHALEIALKERHPTANGYMKIIEMKAAGIEADMHLGAVFGGGNHFEVEILSRIGRILGTLATLRDEFVDVFEIDELRQRISTRSLPLPILLALKEEDVEERIKTILSKPEMTRKDADKLLDIVFHSKPVMNLKEQMEDKKKEGMQLTRSLGNTGLRKKFYAIFEVMLEDL